MKKLLLAASLSIGLALSSPAQNIGVQFWTSGLTTDQGLTSQTAGVVPQDNFNSFDLNQVVGGTHTYPLFDSAGAPTSATLTLTNNTLTYSTGASTSTSNGILLSGEAGDYSGTPATYTFSGLQAGDYDLILYTVSGGETAEFSLVNGSTSGPTTYFDIEQSGTAFNGTFTQGSATSQGTATTANYVEFAGVSPNAGTIEISIPDLYTLPSSEGVNGFQLVELPEPPAVFLAAAALLALLVLGWKYRTAPRG